MYKLLKQEGHARLGDFETVHGTVHMPAFMNVATTGAIRGAVSAYDLKELHCQVQLCNTYHLHLRPGDENVHTLGGLHRFTGWDGPILTDSGGFQVFSLSQLRKITEEGVHFRSHIDGHRIFMGPEESMRIQSHLASTIAMAFDECVENPSPYDYVKKSSHRTIRWLKRCKTEMARLNSLDTTINKRQMLFGINQGGTYQDIRIDNPRYLMGVGTPVNILEAVYRGVDLFDCVMPSRNARHGHIFTSGGVINMNNAKYRLDERPLDERCDCPTCRRHTRAYIHHLIKSGEMLAMRLTVMHNLYFYNTLMEKIREALAEGRYEEFYREQKEALGRRL